MRSRDYGEEVGLTRGFVLEDEGVAFPLDLAVGTCDTFVALGGGGIRELELTLYDAEGDPAATDAVPAEAGLIHVCPQGHGGGQHRPYYMAVRSTDGSGAFVLAHFRGSPGSGEGFEGLFEGIRAPRVPFREVEEQLTRSRTALRARGMAPLAPGFFEHLSEGGVARLPLTLEGGRCYAAAARSGAGLRDVDLFLFDVGGAEVARDVGMDAEPILEHCPDQSGPFTLELRAFEGAGAAGVMVFSAPRPTAAERAEPEPEPEADPGSALAVLAAPLQRRGFAAPLFVARDASITPGEVRSHEVVIGPGCGLVAGASSGDATDLDLYLADAQGREVDRDTAVHSTARVRACRPQPTVFRVAVKAYGREGTYALAALQAPESVDSLQSLRLEEATAPYRMRNYVEALRLEADLGQGQTLRRSIALAAGRCLAVAAAGDDAVADVDLFLRTAAGELVASESGPAPHAAVHRCATVGEELSVEASMYRGTGNVALLALEGP